MKDLLIRWAKSSADDLRSTSKTYRSLATFFVVVGAVVIGCEHSPWFHGVVEGITDLDLTISRSGRCRLDNPRATLGSGGEVLRMGRVVVPGKGLQEHVWGYDKDGRVVDVVCPDTIPLCHETRSNVFGEIRLNDGNVAAVWNTGDPVHIDRVAGILYGQKLAGRL